MPDTPTILLTGATDGLGRALAHRLATSGDARLVLHGRDAEKGAELLAELRAVTGDDDRFSFERADYASLQEIHDLADRVAQLDRLDVLVNNAGMGVELDPRKSREGHELTFQVDYLATYMLSCLLTPLLIRSAPSRIINVSSKGQAPIDFDDVMLRRGWDGGQAYCQAKLAQIMFTIDLAKRLRGTGVTVTAMHPASYMPTKIVTHLFTPVDTLESGTENTYALVAGPAPETGVFYDRRTPARPHPQADDADARARLLALSEELTGVALPKAV